MGHSARFELKYVIEESRAVAVADFVSTYLTPSEHNGSGPIRGHPEISLSETSRDRRLAIVQLYRALGGGWNFDNTQWTNGRQ